MKPVNQLDHLHIIKSECHRFLSKVKILEKELENIKEPYLYTSSKRSAVRRSSLDLSKELSNFRKNLTL
jgi:hypothetical protein